MSSDDISALTFIGSSKANWDRQVALGLDQHLHSSRTNGDSRWASKTGQTERLDSSNWIVDLVVYFLKGALVLTIEVVRAFGPPLFRLFVELLKALGGAAASALRR
jgi:hypothetical protein